MLTSAVAVYCLNLYTRNFFRYSSVISFAFGTISVIALAAVSAAVFGLSTTGFEYTFLLFSLTLTGAFSTDVGLVTF
jgi:hypothetical protein